MAEMNKNLFDGIYSGKKVLITGHTGFKGSWLALWLKRLGAEVIGYSLPPPTHPNHIDHLEVDFTAIEADIRDIDKLKKAFLKSNLNLIQEKRKDRPLCPDNNLKAQSGR